MIYKEEVKDLFSVPNNFYLAHCISADFGMGKGIAVEFNKRFNMKKKLLEKYPNYYNEYVENRIKGDCILEDNVFNLITKARYWNKPTYKTFENALEQMKYICEVNHITKIAMPVIGCGLDKLQWKNVKVIINKVFKDTDVEILVCKRE